MDPFSGRRPTLLTRDGDLPEVIEAAAREPKVSAAADSRKRPSVLVMKGVLRFESGRRLGIAFIRAGRGGYGVFPGCEPVRLAIGGLCGDRISEDYPVRGDLELADLGIVRARA